MQPLAGIRVVDFGQYLAGPLAALLLADNGAEVVRVDPPGGPRWKHPADAMLQRGKRSIALDLRTPADRPVAAELIRVADVVIENFRPGTMARLGLGPVESAEANPRLIYCSIPGFGSTDPRAAVPGWEGVVSAAAGLYRESMFADGADPIFTPVPLASTYAALIAAHSIVAALIVRHRDGLGQQVESSLFDAAFEVIGTTAEMPSTTPGRSDNVTVDPAALKGHLCADDRYVEISPPIRGIEAFITAEIPLELRAPGGDRAELSRYLDRLYRTLSAAEWERHAQEHLGAGMAPCLTSAEWLHDRHALDSNSVIVVDDPILGQTHQAGFAVSLSRTPSRIAFPRRLVDADRASILAELAGLALSPPSVAPTAPPSAHALDGVRVIDATQILAGPTAGRVLAEYGADVIKINNPRLDDNPLAMVGHVTVNAGKRTVLLDIASEVGHEVLMRLVDGADVFHQNFSLGAVRRLGITEEQLRARTSDIIYSSVNTHAAGGFRGSYRGHEELGQAITGMQVRAGGTGAPRLLGLPVNDHATGHLSAFAILLALYHRQVTGVGQAVQAALSRTGSQLQIPFMVDFDGRVWDEPTGPHARGWSATNRLYRASDRWFYVAADGEAATNQLLSVAGLPAGVGVVSDAETGRALEQRFSAEPAATWVARLASVGVGAHVYVPVDELMDDDVVRARGLSVTVDRAGSFRARTIGVSGRLSRTPARRPFPSAAPGWHTGDVLAELDGEAAAISSAPA